MSVIDRLAKHGRVSPTGCWLWTRWTHAKGYGVISVEGRSRYVHIEAYTRFRGAIPENHDIDHLCNIRNCYNPNHLEAVTHQENCRRRDERRLALV